MNMLNGLNEAIQYIENNLCKEIELDKVAKLAGVSKDSFKRFFSYMAGVTLTEYIRRRRLTLAAYDLQQSNERVIDIAIKYGYETEGDFKEVYWRGSKPI